MNKTILTVVIVFLVSTGWCQYLKPGYIKGYACPEFIIDKNADTTACYWLQYMGKNKVNKHVHDYRTYYPDSTWEVSQFVTFDSQEVDPTNKKYVFEYMSSTIPTIIINGKATDIIGAYPVRYPTCYLNRFADSSHKVLTIEPDSGADYPCVLDYNKTDSRVTMLLRRTAGNTTIEFTTPEGIGGASKEIIAIDLKRNKILLENYDHWIDLDLMDEK